ncbi:MAG: hypothetical protein LBC40_04150 [Dysgonamonadaceae bacterium]|jgi:hypothetical protein|nr:hypothetical protein [Dysgonamonadaceae bacterium]
MKRKQAKMADATIPIRIDRHTVVYVGREKLKRHGGKKKYIKWFNEVWKHAQGNLRDLAEW